MSFRKGLMDGRRDADGPGLTDGLAQIFVAVRVGAIAEVLACSDSPSPWFTHPGRIWVATVFAAENLVLLCLVLWLRRVPDPVQAVDMAVLVGLTVAMGALSADPRAHNWENWPFVYSTVAMFGIGVVCRSARRFAALEGVLLAVYCWIYFVAVGSAFVDGAIDLLTGIVNGALGWTVGRALDRRSRELTALHATSVRQAETTGRAVEDMRADLVIRRGAVSVLEKLAGSPSLAEAFKEHIAKEAADLTALAGADRGESGDCRQVPLAELLSGIETLPHDYRHRFEALEVDVTVSDLDTAAAVLPTGTAEALLGAVRESVNNAVKHAQADRIIVRMRCSAAVLEAEIADTGTGFDPARARAGFGLAGSVRDRLAAVGGSAEIDSAPGRGTTVRLSVLYPCSVEATRSP